MSSPAVGAERVHVAEEALDELLVGPRAVKIATQGSGPLARTSPPENEARNLAGMLSRFFASSEYSKWPLNANGHIPGRRVRPESRSGRSPATPVVCVAPPYPTISHFATLFPTFPSDASEHGRTVALFRLYRAEKWQR